MDMCSLAQLKLFFGTLVGKIMFDGLLFLPNVLIGLYTFFTAWPPEQTSLVNTQVWMENFCMQSKQGP